MWSVALAEAFSLIMAVEKLCSIGHIPHPRYGCKAETARNGFLHCPEKKLTD